MKQFNTLQKNKTPREHRSIWRLWVFMLLSVLAGTASSYGQVLTWQPTGVDEIYRNGLDEGKNLEIYIFANSAVNDAKIVVTLPKGIQVNTPATLTGMGSNTVSYGEGLLTNSGDNTVITFPVTGGLNQNDLIHACLGIWANSDAVVKESAFDQIKVKVIDGASATVDDDEKAVNVVVKNPVITGAFGNIEGTDYENGVTHSVLLKSVGGKTKGFSLTLTVDNTFTLNDFVLEGGSPLSITPKDNNYVISLPNEELDATGKTLTFKSIHPLMGGSRTIQASITTPYNQTGLITNKTFVVPVEDAGTPNMERTGLLFVTDNTGADNLCYGDGKHPSWDGLSYARVVYKNTDTGSAAYFQAQVLVYSGLSYFKDGEEVKYKIGTTGAIKTVPASQVTYRNLLIQQVFSWMIKRIGIYIYTLLWMMRSRAVRKLSFISRFTVEIRT